MIFDAELGVHALGDDEGCPVTMNNLLGILILYFSLYSCITVSMNGEQIV